jgi:hypothetical protein
MTGRGRALIPRKQGRAGKTTMIAGTVMMLDFPLIPVHPD